MVEHIWLIWFGEKPNKTRLNAINSYVKFKNKICIVTEKNLHKYETQSFPIHESFYYLSEVHKSDYLRAYLTYLYGGGYSDIKECQCNWDSYFSILKNDSEIDLVSCPQYNAYGITQFTDDDVVLSQERERFDEYPCFAQFIVRENSRISEMWINQIHNILNSKSEALKNNKSIHPYYHSGTSFLGKQNEYPLKWDEIAGNTFLKIIYENNLFERCSLEMPQMKRGGGHRGRWDGYKYV